MRAARRLRCPWPAKRDSDSPELCHRDRPSPNNNSAYITRHGRRKRGALRARTAVFAIQLLQAPRKAMHARLTGNFVTSPTRICMYMLMVFLAKFKVVRYTLCDMFQFFVV